MTHSADGRNARAPGGGRHVLLIGWKPGLGAAAIARGLRPVVIYGAGDRNWDGPIPESGCIPVFCENPAVLESSFPALLRSGIGLAELAGVCPAGEDYVIPAAEYAALLQLPGLPLATAVACRDKAVQKTLARSAEVPHARFRAIPDPEGLLYGAEKLCWETYPAVLKSLSGSGTISVAVVGSEEDIQRALSGTGGVSSPCILEEFVAADEEWELDGYVEKGEIKFLSIGVYTWPLLAIRDGFPAQVVILDPSADSGAFAKARDIVPRTLAALGLTDSVFHMELFVRSGDGALIFGECGARPAGSAIPEAVAVKYGIDLWSAHLDLWLGRPVTQEPRIRSSCVGMTQLNTVPGTLIDHPTVEDILSQPGVVNAHLQYPHGWSMRSSRDGVPYRIGTVVVTGDDRRRTQERLRELREWFSRNLCVGPSRENQAPAWVLRDGPNREP